MPVGRLKVKNIKVAFTNKLIKLWVAFIKIIIIIINDNKKQKLLYKLILKTIKAKTTWSCK